MMRKKFIFRGRYLILIAFTFFILLGALTAFFLTYFAEHSDNQQRFQNGEVPIQLPDGFLQGSVNFESPWQGKIIDSAAGKGINVIKTGDSTQETLPFKIYTGKGIRDRELDVIKFSYNLPENPFYLRPILDEVVQVAPGKYLG